MHVSLTNLVNLGTWPTIGLIATGSVVAGSIAGTAGYFNAKVLESTDPKGAAAYHGGGTASAVIAAAASFEMTSKLISGLGYSIFPVGDLRGYLISNAAGPSMGALNALTVGVFTYIFAGKGIANLTNHPVSWKYVFLGDFWSKVFDKTNDAK